MTTPNSSTSRDLIPSSEVCRRLGVDRRTLTRWVANGRIEPAIKLPGLRGAYLFDPAVVDRAAEQRAA